jgi:hypothetical protein
VFKQPAVIAASAPIDRIDIAFIICFLVHKEAGLYRVKRHPTQIATKTLRLVRKVLRKSCSTKTNPPAGMNQRADRETSRCLISAAVTLAHLGV